MFAQVNICIDIGRVKPAWFFPGMWIGCCRDSLKIGDIQVSTSISDGRYREEGDREMF